MKRFRSVLSLCLALVAIFLVSCSSPQVSKGPLYTTEQLAQIQDYAADVQEMRDRMLGIPPLVQKGQWIDLSSYIHGPLGELRVKMSRLARTLEPKKAQPAALEAVREVFKHINLIDEATMARDSRKAFLNYNEALKDFDAFLKYVPTNS